MAMFGKRGRPKMVNVRPTPKVSEEQIEEVMEEIKELPVPVPTPQKQQIEKIKKEVVAEETEAPVDKAIIISAEMIENGFIKSIVISTKPLGDVGETLEMN